MKYNIYKLKPKFVEDEVFKGPDAPELVFTLDTEDKLYCEYMEENWYENLAWSDEVQKALEQDTFYYVVAEDYSDFGVLILYKGYSYFDVAEHDDRIVIAVELGLTPQQVKVIDN